MIDIFLIIKKSYSSFNLQIINLIFYLKNIGFLKYSHKFCISIFFLKIN